MPKCVIKKIKCPHCGNEQQVKYHSWTVNAKCQNKKCKKWFNVESNMMSN